MTTLIDRTIDSRPGSPPREGVRRAATLFIERAEPDRAVGTDPRGIGGCIIDLACVAMRVRQTMLAARRCGGVEAELLHVGTFLADPSTSGARLRAAGLTPREVEVAGLLARGFRNRDIAAALVITPKTAANHVQRILDKLGLVSRAEVAARAVDLGLRATGGIFANHW
jgi:DNA-binding CsgD family transcriptional regulator